MALPEQFFNAIIAAEGTGKRGNPYDEVLGYGKYGRPSTPVSQLTIAQAIQAGEAVRKNPKNPHNSSAIGAFQITAQNLRTAIREWGFDPNAPFNAQTQKAIAAKIYDQQGLKAWEGFKSHPQAKAVARQAASGATAVASAPPMPTPRPASYNPAQTQSLMAALGVAQQPAAEPVQRVSGLDRFNDPALGFAPTPAPSPAVLAANAEAMPSIPRPPSSIPNPTPRPTYNANQPVPPSPPDMPTQKEYRYTALPSGPLTPPPSLPNPTTPSAGNGSFSVDDFKQAMRDAGKAIGEDPAAVEQLLQRWDQMTATMPELRAKADSSLATALAGSTGDVAAADPQRTYPGGVTARIGSADNPMDLRGKGGGGYDPFGPGNAFDMLSGSGQVAGMPDMFAGSRSFQTARSEAAGQQPRAVATTSERPPAGGFEPPLGGLIGTAEAAPMMTPAIAGRPAGMTAQSFDARFNAEPDPNASYKALTGAPVSTLADFGFDGVPKLAQPQVQPPVIEPAQPPMPRQRPQAAVQPPSPLAKALSSPIARAGLGYALGGPLGALLGGGAALIKQNGGLGAILGADVLPTRPGAGTQSVYTTPSGQSFDTTPGSHGSYVVAGDTIYSPSEYIDRMNNSGGWY